MTDNHHINPLIKSTLIYILATALGQGMAFLAIVVFTRIMPRADYGRYSDYYAYVSVFTVLIGANLYYALNNAYIDKKEDIKAFRKTVLYLSAMIAAAVTLLVWLVSCVVLKLVSSFLVLMAALHSYSCFVINYRTYSANMENDYQRKLWLLILPNTLQLIFSILMILAFPHITFHARIIGSVAGVTVIAVALFSEMVRDKGLIIRLDYWKYALRISVPSMLMSISYMIMQQCDKVMITRICGPEETAVYAVIYYLGYALTAVNLAAAPVRQAWIYQKLDQGDTDEARGIQKWYLVLMVGMATLVLMLGPAILHIIAPADYHHYEYIVPFVVGACMMLLYYFYTEIILFYKRNLLLSSCVFISAVVNVILNAIFIPKFGAVAACYTTASSYLLLFIMTGIVSGKLAASVYSVPYFLVFIVWVFAAAAISLVTSVTSVLRYILYLVAVLIIILYLVRNRVEWKCFLKK